MPTTRKEARSVVVKREVVQRERGWRCEGMVVVEEMMEVARVHAVLELQRLSDGHEAGYPMHQNMYSSGVGSFLKPRTQH